MTPPSHLSIAAKSVQRLLKEEASYHKELATQEAQVKQLEEQIQSGQQTSEDGNDEFMLKQRKLGVDETKAVFEPLRQRIAEAVGKLEDQIAAREKVGAPEEEMQMAKETLAQAKAQQNGAP